jgi:dephospho-CoA kinase
MRHLKKNIVGLTGGIGVGKSVVADIFRVLGVPVFNADLQAALLLENNKEIRKKIQEEFAEDMFFEGKPDRKKLAKRVFSNQEELNKLNQIVHPVLFDDFQLWADKQDSGIVMIEVAILFESGADRFVDTVIAVTAPRALRIARVIERDHCSEDDVLERMDKQMDQEQVKKRSGYVIVNDMQQLLVPQVVSIYNELKNEE